ncbi:hypothetical protein HDU98_004330, partial [Podochytrium sp. JEL0797]
MAPAAPLKKLEDVLPDNVFLLPPSSTTPTGASTGLPTTTPPTPDATKPASRQRNFHGIHGVYHGQYQKQDVRGDSNLSTQVRQAIVDHSRLRVLEYEPERATVRNENKYESWDSKLIASERARRKAFGIPFSQACDNQQVKVQEAPKRTVPNDEIDWMNLKIDAEKQVLFQHMSERQNKHAWDEETDSVHTIPAKKAAKPKVALPSLHSKPHRLQRTAKEIEDQLHIIPNPPFLEIVEKFFVTREEFYEQQGQLNQLLDEDLTRLDTDRKQLFVQKFKSLHIQKNGMFAQDMKGMRHRSARETESAKAAELNQHAWYFELLNKVGKSPSRLERILLERIRIYIENRQEFTQNVFVQMMKLIPQRLFNEDPIQRIIRFVKQHSDITERDFLEAIELANHEMKFTN